MQENEIMMLASVISGVAFILFMGTYEGIIKMWLNHKYAEKQWRIRVVGDIDYERMKGKIVYVKRISEYNNNSVYVESDDYDFDKTISIKDLAYPIMTDEAMNRKSTKIVAKGIPTSKNKKRRKMPRIFKFMFYWLLVMLAWKFVNNIEEILMFFASKI
jgi:hypothetical protein